MNEWFEVGSDYTFYSYGTSHIITLIAFSLMILFFLTCSRWIQSHRTVMNGIRYTLVVILFASEVSYQTWAATNGVWNTADHLPLHLCGIASFLAIIALLTYHTKLIQIVFFIGIVPAMMAVITPDLPFDYQHFRFWKFFLHHMAITWASVFLIMMTPVKITWKSMFETFGYLVMYAILMGILNTRIDSNYLYLNNTPESGTPLNVLGDGIWYIVNLTLLTFSIFVVLVLIYKISSYLASRKDSGQQAEKAS
ncbi:YwaF family protein [Thalassobacillus hwangdonensis]